MVSPGKNLRKWFPCATVKKMVGFSLTMVLASCQSYPVPSEYSPFATIPEGFELVLHRAIKVPADDWSVYFQSGRLKSFGKVDEYAPYCELYLGGAKGRTWTLEAGRFTVTQVRYEVEERARRQEPFRPVPAAQTRQLLHDFMPVHFTTTFDLRSKTQPAVRSLSCSHLQEPRVGQHLSIQQIREALGGTWTLTLPEP